MNETEAIMKQNLSIDDILSQLVQDTEALTALLISRHGICLGQSGSGTKLNATALAALVAGMFSATKEVSLPEFLLEPWMGFLCQPIHQGKGNSTSIS